MPRNGSGVYSLPESAFVSQTPISSTAVNSDFSDIADALTASLPRNGEAGMTGVLPLAATGFSYTIDPDTGMRRSAANEQMISCGGTDVVKITEDGIFDGVTGASLGFAVGVPYIWPFSTAPTGCVLLYGQACTSSYPIIRGLLIADGSPYGNNGTDPLFPDYRGVTPVGKSNMGGSDKGNLTGGTVLGAILGAQTVTLDSSTIPAHTHGVSGSTSVESNDHTHGVSGTTSNESNGHTHGASEWTSGVQNAGHTHGVSFPYTQRNLSNSAAGTDFSVFGLGSTTSAGLTTGDQSQSHFHGGIGGTTGTNATGHTHTFGATSTGVNVSHFHTFNVTSTSFGSGAAHNNVQPSIVQNWIMRVA